MNSLAKSVLSVGQHKYFPDLTGQRKAEGGNRLSAIRHKQSDLPLVSIVTVVYNAENTLERTIRSVLKQIYENIEYIIIDGGSIDRSIPIVEKYKESLEYYISEPDQGVYHAMNKGISLAQGDYICLLNADDHYAESFVSKSIDHILKTHSDIVYSDFFISGTRKYAGSINEGIYIHYLNINHSTFLVSKKAYKEIGLYREEYKIVSDAVWMRLAYTKGLKFSHLAKSLFYFEEGGLSSGNDEEKRKLFIEEAGRSYREHLPFLASKEAEELYVSRFNISRIDTLQKLHDRYGSKENLFTNALRGYLKFMLSNNIVFANEHIASYLPAYASLAKKLSIDYSYFNILCPNFNINATVEHIGTLARTLETSRKNNSVILHFASVFSAPSETFIYDLIQRMESAGKYSNVVLCDTRLLEKERPYEACLPIDWEGLPSQIRDFLYLYVFEKINPNVIVAHFAINGWKIHQRLKDMHIKLPMIHMTHGIDVFTISTNDAYGEYILKDASIDPNTAFTTVSHYLFDELTSRGVPSEKIINVPNVVHNRFFEHRKCSGYYDGSRRLELLNIGRLIELKGHKELIEGLAYYVDMVSANVHLTIIYSKTENELASLKTLISEYKLDDKVTLISYIDFNKKPDYYAHFDLYISSSKYSDGAIYRSESFGMSVLEAIAAGLPVIVTDAGGSPEVVGDDNIFAKIVPHADGIAIGKAIETLVKIGHCFQDNIDYAQDRLSRFSAKRQLEKLEYLITKITSKKMSVGSFTSIIQGGAGKASVRVHKALMINNINSSLITKNNNIDKTMEPGYLYLSPEIGLQWELMKPLSFNKNHLRQGFTLYSFNEPSLRRETLRKIVSTMDVVNIQWIAGFLSVEDIAYLSNLTVPLVITVRDMHPLSGGCHNFHGCDRWQTDCYGCPQLLEDKEHFPSKVLSIKKMLWNMKNITFVALSQHTKEIIKSSALYQRNRIEVIGNPIDLESFSPSSKNEARAYFNIASESPLLFYMPSYGSRVKGAHEFKEALRYLKQKYPLFQITLLMAGSATALVDAHEYDFPIIHLGHIKDDLLLAKAYSAADATIIPSLEETFSNTAAESVSCDTPIVGFQTGAIPEIAGNGLRGESVPVGDTEALGEAIYRVLSKPETIGICRSYAEKNFSYKEQGSRYAALYEELCNAPAIEAKIDPDTIPIIDPQITADIFCWQAKASSEKTREATSRMNAKIKEIDSVNTNLNDCNKKYQEANSLIMKQKEINNTDQLVKEEFRNTFEELIAINFRKNPIKKIKTYKKLLAVWDRHRGAL